LIGFLLRFFLRFPVLGLWWEEANGGEISDRQKAICCPGSRPDKSRTRGKLPDVPVKEPKNKKQRCFNRYRFHIRAEENPCSDLLLLERACKEPINAASIAVNFTPELKRISVPVFTDYPGLMTDTSHGRSLLPLPE
jgi:hypothetical protein